MERATERRFILELADLADVGSAALEPKMNRLSQKEATGLPTVIAEPGGTCAGGRALIFNRTHTAQGAVFLPQISDWPFPNHSSI